MAEKKKSMADKKRVSQGKTPLKMLGQLAKSFKGPRKLKKKKKDDK